MSIVNVTNQTEAVDFILLASVSRKFELDIYKKIVTLRYPQDKYSCISRFMFVIQRITNRFELS